MRSPLSVASSRHSPSGREETATPMSSASSVSRVGGEKKRIKLEAPPGDELDEIEKPVFLKMSFRKGGELDTPDNKVEDDETYNARPWQERSTMIPLILAFRLQFHDLFDGVPDMGPQDLEEGLQADVASSDVQELMCRLLTLAANRARPVEYPQYNRPLNDCVATHYATRGDPVWLGANPLAANRRFLDLGMEDRLRLMYCLLDWALTDSKVVRDKIEEAYKNRTAPRIHTLNPYEMNVIGRDDRKHGYYLIKGNNTRFRLYIETDLSKSPTRWYSICSTLEELRRFTSELSDSAKTVRCRKIVDDLASIHIPEVERAETVRKQLQQKKLRAEQERQRRAAYASEALEVRSDRGGRTRGRRIDYQSMLQDQDGDEDPNNDGLSTPDVPQSSRSGRMLKKPRGWDDASPDGEARTALIDSHQIPTSIEDDESYIVILKYNTSLYSPQKKTLGPEKTEIPRDNSTQNMTVPTATPKAVSDELLSLTKMYGPIIAAQMIQSKEIDTRSSASDGMLKEALPEEASGQSSSLSGGQNQEMKFPSKDEPKAYPTAPSTPHEGNLQESEMRSNAMPLVSSTSTANRTPRPGSHCLIIATIVDMRLDMAFLDNLLADTVTFAQRHSLHQLDILLHSNARTSNHLRSANSFSFLQKAISSLYIKTTKLGKDCGLELDLHVIFNDWCGYNLAQEDIHWAAIGAVSSDQKLVQDFVRSTKDTYPDRHTPAIITVDSPSRTADENLYGTSIAAREYDVVAVGGTFDHLHAGHKILLTMTAWLAQRKLVCGITDDALLQNKKYKEVMQDLDTRRRSVKAFFYRVKRGIEYQLLAINDVAGPTGSDASIQALVASRETEAGSEQIKEIRKEKNLPPLDILFIDVVGPEGHVEGEQMAALKLSSTAIRATLASKL